jgi:ATP-dependent Clp protease ATP-binding subunit ClpA
MYQKFTDRARKVMQLAQGEARDRGWLEIFPSHLLRGIIKEGSGIGCAVLRNLEVDTDRLLADLDLVEVDGPNPKGVRKPGQFGEPVFRLTPGAQRDVGRAIDEARNLNHDHVGSEHLLLGMLHPDNPENKILNRHGVTLEKAREEILMVLGHDVRSVKPDPCPPILKTFANHTPGENGLSRIRRVRAAFSTLHQELTLVCPQSRELSIALTHLETAAMWATKSVAVHDPEAQVDTSTPGADEGGDT